MIVERNCCDGLCSQGRECPRRPIVPRALDWAQVAAATIVGLCGCAALLAFFDVLTP